MGENKTPATSTAPNNKDKPKPTAYKNTTNKSGHTGSQFTLPSSFFFLIICLFPHSTFPGSNAKLLPDNNIAHDLKNYGNKP